MEMAIGIIIGLAIAWMSALYQQNETSIRIAIFLMLAAYIIVLGIVAILAVFV